MRTTGECTQVAERLLAARKRYPGSSAPAAAPFEGAMAHIEADGTGEGAEPEANT